MEKIGHLNVPAEIGVEAQEKGREAVISIGPLRLARLRLGYPRCRIYAKARRAAFALRWPGAKLKSPLRPVGRPAAVPLRLLLIQMLVNEIGAEANIVSPFDPTDVDGEVELRIVAEIGDEIIVRPEVVEAVNAEMGPASFKFPR